MKIKISVGTVHGKRVIRCVAKIMKSGKHNIPRTVQRTWRVYTDLAETDAYMRKTFHIQAKRWQHSWLTVWFGTPDKFPQQMEIEDEHNAESQQAQPVPDLSQERLVSGGEVGGVMHEDSVTPPEGNV